MCIESMIPTYHYSVSSPMSLDLNEDHTHQLFSTNRQDPSSSSSLSNSIIFNPDLHQGGSSYSESEQLQSNHKEAEKIIPTSGSWDHPAAEKDENRSDVKVRIIRKKEDGYENVQSEDSSMKWIPSKKRMMWRMMVSDQMGFDIADISKHKYEEKNPPLSPLGADNSTNSSSNHSNIIVRVCADCHTAKTPLWRSGPKGPKSLCNACGIRQRKARQAAIANGMVLVEGHVKKGSKLQSKRVKKSKSTHQCASQLKKKSKLGTKARGGRKRFEDLSKNLALQQVFPQDEKEAAILLMALSYGLLHGFPSDQCLHLSD
ncbi:hypothetical protein VNO77_23224 [Canavalia gladiata]|uniref:GATA-type domain-containing protein n=1 Tax=Canavalia gladiata TaxID=3824 RepID=A0AAN9L9A6_CANGL